VHLGARSAAPAQADHVQSDQRAGLAEREAERDDVVARRRSMWWYRAEAKVGSVLIAEAEVGAIVTED